MSSSFYPPSHESGRLSTSIIPPALMPLPRPQPQPVAFISGLCKPLYGEQEKSSNYHMVLLDSEGEIHLVDHVAEKWAQDKNIVRNLSRPIPLDFCEYWLQISQDIEGSQLYNVPAVWRDGILLSNENRADFFVPTDCHPFKDQGGWDIEVVGEWTNLSRNTFLAGYATWIFGEVQPNDPNKTWEKYYTNPTLPLPYLEVLYEYLEGVVFLPKIAELAIEVEITPSELAEWLAAGVDWEETSQWKRTGATPDFARKLFASWLGGEFVGIDKRAITLLEEWVYHKLPIEKLPQFCKRYSNVCEYIEQTHRFPSGEQLLRIDNVVKTFLEKIKDCNFPPEWVSMTSLLIPSWVIMEDTQYDDILVERLKYLLCTVGNPLEWKPEQTQDFEDRFFDERY